MTRRNSLLVPALVALVASPAMAQQNAAGEQLALNKAAVTADTTKLGKPTEEKEGSKASLTREITIQNMRPQDQRGVNMFEAPKDNTVPFTGFKLDWGAAFTQQFQSLEHQNTAAVRTLKDAAGKEYNANELLNIGTGFNNAAANLYLNAQLAPGIRVALTTYLSSRHHNEAWVKDGYLLIDESPINHPVLNTLMDYVTVKAGHFEVNYGDAHFRRSDNGNAMYNPFVGNLILDALTTEIGAEVLLRHKGFLALGGITGGEIKGNIASPDDRSPAFLAKLGVDQQLTPELRVRLTGSAYTNSKSPANTLYAGDRAGSRYYSVLENTVSTTAAQFSSGLINPGFRRNVTSYMLNPFVKFHGLEVFGVAERAEGKAANETQDRRWTQYAGDVVYRFLPREQL